MKYYCNGIKHDHDTFLTMIYNAGVTILEIIDMYEGYSFTGNDGIIYEIEKD